MRFRTLIFGILVWAALAIPAAAQQVVPDPRIVDLITADEDAVQLINLPSGRGSAAIVVSDYCTCTLVIEGRVGAIWEAIDGAPTIDADGVYSVSAAGLEGIRVRASAWTMTTTTIALRVSSAGGGSGAGGGVSSTVAISQSGSDNAVDVLTVPPAAASAPEFVQCSNGTIAAACDVSDLGIGSTGDAPATAGSTGSVNAKLRLLTADLDAVKASLATLDNIVSGSGINVSQIGGASPITSRCMDDSKVTSVPISTATSGNVQLVALTASAIVYICGWDVIAAGTVNVQLVSGSDADCTTTETNLTGVYQLTAQAGLARANGGAVQTKTIVSHALCIELSTTVQVDGLLTYVKE